MPVRIDIESGAEYLLPYAKKRLQQLKEQAKQLRVPSLSKKETAGAGSDIFLSTLILTPNLTQDSIRITAGVYTTIAVGTGLDTGNTKFFNIGNRVSATVTPRGGIFNGYTAGGGAANPTASSPGHFSVGFNRVPFTLPDNRIPTTLAIGFCLTDNKFFFSVIATDGIGAYYVLIYNQTAALIAQWSLPLDADVSSGAQLIASSLSEAWFELSGTVSRYLFSTAARSVTISGFNGISDQPLCIGLLNTEPVYIQATIDGTNHINGVAYFTAAGSTTVFNNSLPGAGIYTDIQPLFGATFIRDTTEYLEIFFTSFNVDLSGTLYSQDVYIYSSESGLHKVGTRPHDLDVAPPNNVLASDVRMYQLGNYAPGFGHTDKSVGSKNISTPSCFAFNSHLYVPVVWATVYQLFSGSVGGSVPPPFDLYQNKISVCLYSITTGEQKLKEWTIGIDIGTSNITSMVTAATLVKTNSNIAAIISPVTVGGSSELYVCTPSATTSVGPYGASDLSWTSPEKDKSFLFLGNAHEVANRVLAIELFSGTKIMVDETITPAPKILPKTILGTAYFNGKAYAYYEPDISSGYNLAAMNSSGNRIPMQKTGTTVISISRETFPMIEKQFTLWNN